MTSGAPLGPAEVDGGSGGGRPLRRDASRGIVGGVVAGIGARLGIEVGVVRVAFAIGVVVTGGALLAAYVLAWALIPADDGSAGLSAPDGTAALPPSWPARARGTRSWHLGAGVGLLMLSALLVFRELGIWWSDPIVWPLVTLSAGLALLWGQSRRSPQVGGGPAQLPPPAAALMLPTVDADVASVAAPAEQAPRFAGLYRGGFGIALVLGAALLFLSANDALGAARDVAITAVVAIVALALMLAPFIWRLGRNLAAERAERIRSQERAEVGAHLHDSVLQTLTLMQKRADDPREVAALARRQERELRNWLSSGSAKSPGGAFVAALREAAEDVEDAQRVKIEVVAVGDCELDARAAAVVAATGEALTNAAKFAPGGEITAYAEVTPERIEAFVRDRGPGFDPAAIPDDRHGVRESIVGRMRRHGGDASIRRVPGSGTEVALTIERVRP